MNPQKYIELTLITLTFIILQYNLYCVLKYFLMVKIKIKSTFPSLSLSISYNKIPKNDFLMVRKIIKKKINRFSDTPFYLISAILSIMGLLSISIYFIYFGSFNMFLLLIPILMYVSLFTICELSNDFNIIKDKSLLSDGDMININRNQSISEILK